MIPFSKFAPDIDPTTPGVITACENLVPTVRGYKGGPSGVDVGLNALAAAAVSAVGVTKLDATSRFIVGTATKLYEKNGTAWTDVSGAAYSASASIPWRFAQFGNTTLAVNKQDVLQQSVTGAFAAVATAPKAAAMCVVNGFVMLANTNDGVNNDVDRWWCSGYMDVTNWTPSIASQCASARLVDTPGAITCVKALGYDVVAYKDRSIYIGQYGGAAVWSFRLIPGDAGCSSQEAIADIGNAHIFISHSDIYIFNGSTTAPIGAVIREWFFNDLDPAFSLLIRHNHDRANSLLYFHYPRRGGGGVLNGCIVYNYKSDKWGVAHRTIECAVEYVASGFDYDGIPMSDWDSWPAVSYDSAYWTASSLYPAYIGTDHKLYSLTGGSTSSSLTTGDYGSEDMYYLLRRVTPRYLTKPTSATMTNYTQTVHGGAWTEDATTTENNGRFDRMKSAPWHRAKFDFTGDVEISGVSADMKPSGVL